MPRSAGFFCSKKLPPLSKQHPPMLTHNWGGMPDMPPFSALAAPRHPNVTPEVGLRLVPPIGWGMCGRNWVFGSLQRTSTKIKLSFFTNLLNLMDHKPPTPPYIEFTQGAHVSFDPIDEFGPKPISPVKKLETKRCPEKHPPIFQSGTPSTKLLVHGYQIPSQRA